MLNEDLVRRDRESKHEQRERVISQLREVVEKILEDERFAENNYRLRKIRKLLTTDKDKDISIKPNDFFGLCGEVCDELQQALAIKGIETRKASSADDETNGHQYLTLTMLSDILIDASIGQFIKGHPWVFVGTRKELEDLTVNQTGEGKKYQITSTRSSRKPKEAFRRIWGKRKIRYYG